MGRRNVPDRPVTQNNNQPFALNFVGPISRFEPQLGGDYRLHRLCELRSLVPSRRVRGRRDDAARRTLPHHPR